jgi:hypothetical protein
LVTALLRLGENLHQCRLVEFIERRHHRQTADELRNQTETHQIGRFDVRQNLAEIFGALLANELRQRSRCPSFRNAAG